MADWVIEKSVPHVRGSLEAGTLAQTQWVQDDAAGVFASRAIAIRALMVGLEPALKDAPDEFVSRHYAAHARNLKHFRVRKI